MADGMAPDGSLARSDGSLPKLSAKSADIR